VSCGRLTLERTLVNIVVSYRIVLYDALPVTLGMLRRLVNFLISPLFTIAITITIHRLMNFRLVHGTL